MLMNMAEGEQNCFRLNMFFRATFLQYLPAN